MWVAVPATMQAPVATCSRQSWSSRRRETSSNVGQCCRVSAFEWLATAAPWTTTGFSGGSLWCHAPPSHTYCSQWRLARRPRSVWSPAAPSARRTAHRGPPGRPRHRRHRAATWASARRRRRWPLAPTSAMPPQRQQQPQPHQHQRRAPLAQRGGRKTWLQPTRRAPLRQSQRAANPRAWLPLTGPRRSWQLLWRPRRRRVAVSCCRRQS